MTKLSFDRNLTFDDVSELVFYADDAIAQATKTDIRGWRTDGFADAGELTAIQQMTTGTLWAYYVITYEEAPCGEKTLMRVTRGEWGTERFPLEKWESDAR